MASRAQGTEDTERKSNTGAKFWSLIILPVIFWAVADLNWLPSGWKHTDTSPAIPKESSTNEVGAAASTAGIQPRIEYTPIDLNRPISQISISADIPRIEREWDKTPNYSETKVLKIIDDKNLSNQIPLTFVIFKDSGWTLNEVMGKLKRTAEIYGVQCGINFNPVMILETRAAAGPTFDWKDAWAHIISIDQVTARVLFKPLVYLLKNEINGDADGGAAWRRSGESGRKSKEVRDSAILFRTSAILSQKSAGIESSARLGYYEVLAHELGHVLMDVGDADTVGDIMSDFRAQRTNKVLSTQCDQIYTNFLLTENHNNQTVLHRAPTTPKASG